MSRSLTLTVLPGEYAVVCLDANAAVPAWATQQKIFSVTRTADELSVLCRTSDVPDCQQVQTGFRAIKAEGPFDFSAVGVLVSVLQPLANVQISIFAVSTYDTDYIFLVATDLEQAIDTLRHAGHSIQTQEPD